MSKFWSPLAASLVPYVPGEQPKDKTYVKLNTNENPYPPSPAALKAMEDAVNDDLRLYPDPTCDELVRAAANYCGLSPEQTFVGNGSDEVLAFAFAAFFDPAKPLLFPDITYSFYKVYAKLYGLSPKLIPLDEEFNIPMEQFQGEHGGIIMPNPNAPTAQLIPLSEIRSLLERNPDNVVIIDEAYIDFGGQSAVTLVPQFPNLLVVQTLSKSRSLAGLRVGFAFGSEELIDGLNRIKNSFNSYTMDRVALRGAVASLADEAYFRETTDKVIATRERVARQVKELGFRSTDSKANFLFIEHPAIPASELFAELRERGVLVRYFNSPRIDNYLRVSIGTDEEMNTFVGALREIVE
ncbi:histidinol-phosphate transaminase [Paenibacillus agaridevorans]|uniref:Histidinol-phosphate aminotransferase n=1 Tax=Paenibacillus agaridevorans TaxID=171404 RepID=A0A2R5ESR8_9BACL|nr:histidinol-phosphate transaminase [Paenibacillus agaridevorans]GBG09732.1 histidinol-phosphate transaminase [Paenibacillus agaridevorans]